MKHIHFFLNTEKSEGICQTIKSSPVVFILLELSEFEVAYLLVDKAFI